MRIARWGLAARLLAAIVVVVLAGSATAWAVASAIGPAVFHLHIEQSGTSDPGVVRHSEEAFATASAYSLGLALAAALATSVLVSIFLTRRIAHSLDPVRQAAAKVAGGDYSARVPEVGMGNRVRRPGTFVQHHGRRPGPHRADPHPHTRRPRHEMRTPVATLDGYLEGIQDGVVPVDEETLAMLRDQVSRLARLAQDISLVTTAEEGRLTMHRQQVRVGALLDAAQAQAAARYAVRGIDLDVTASTLVRETVVSADVDRMGQVLTNLLDNALRHTAAGGLVGIHASREGGTVRIEVTDDGEGIAAEHLPHLFERFYRADTARDRAHGGSGIGLAVTRSIVRSHGGEVTATSAGKGQGAAFTVELPAADVA
ncbi:histidine kinase/DNA gyrase B/HSP90-like ATPase [Georgenia soli]|uniref:histidine kinase n=1 Tax=Georgenia soli TaxID=638953 RepID=A0A2A9F0E3_9MICO|nr:ATP-binding protein [Georgenia soli]PFG44867.1 histidine kinase/DNA gyrase B/HSP90-like ATPase [Georgenia soli]